MLGWWFFLGNKHVNPSIAEERVKLVYKRNVALEDEKASVD